MGQWRSWSPSRSEGGERGSGAKSEAGQPRGQGVAESGGARARDDGLKGERRRRGPTV